MKLFRRSIALLWFVAATSFACRGASASAGSAPVLIFIVRNAEQVAGSGQTLPLTDKGRARAELLARMMETAGVSAIFSSQMSWTQETVAPLAARRKLQPMVVPFEETDRLVAELEKLTPGAVALVANQGGRIPILIEKLTGMKGLPVKGHDQLFVVARQANGVASLAELRYGVSE